MVVEKRVLIKVVFPKPDSPATFLLSENAWFQGEDLTRTIIVNAAPRLATILCLVQVNTAILEEKLSASQAHLWFGN